MIKEVYVSLLPRAKVGNPKVRGKPYLILAPKKILCVFAS